MKRESTFQRDLIAELKKIFRGCLVIKLDARYIQGIPDLIILYKNKWASLECKRSKNAKRQPNQEYYVDLMKKMAYSSFIYPENKEEVINELQQALKC